MFPAFYNFSKGTCHVPTMYTVQSGRLTWVFRHFSDMLLYPVYVAHHKHAALNNIRKRIKI